MNINKIKLSGTTYNIQDENATKTVELTQAQYDALAVKDPNTFYIITDATAGDLSNYYTKSETSGATQIATALNAKQDTLVSGTNIKTINNESILGSGNIEIEGGGGGKAVSGGTNISITTGETADTINCTLPIRYNNYYSVAVGHTANTLADYGSFTWGGTPFFDASYNTANQFSQAGGYRCRANGLYSLAIGRENSAKTDFSVALNGWNFTSNQYETALGTGNVSVSSSSAFGDSGNTLFSVGNGRGNGFKNVHNAIEIRQNGDIYIADTNDTSTTNYYEKPMIKLQDALGGTVDTALDSGSTNPVENRVIYNKIDEVEQVTAAALNELNDRISEDEEVTAAGLNALNDNFDGLKLKKLTQAEYNALATKDASTLYIIVN